MDSVEYNKLLKDNITQKYELADDKTVQDIETEFNEIASTLNISDRINQTAKKAAFVTLKDHKENFESRPKCRLINPTKSEIGKVSKIMLDRINRDIKDKCSVNQWKSTKDVLDWFNNLNNKSTLSFLVFDIVEYYPSITENLLEETLTWAKNFTDISEVEHDTIMHARKTLLFDNSERPWMKKSCPNAFDVAMGAFDGAEICELVGLFILNELESNLGAESVGLYRDDGLAVLRKCSGCSADRKRKRIIKLFKKFGLRITVEANLKSVNYLDVHLDLATGIHKPYRKPNNPPVYINTSSNHPPVITRNIPDAIGKRISSLSSNKENFDQTADAYNAALESSGYTETIKFSNGANCNARARGKENKRRNRKNRKRKVIWFNPPYSMDVKTNVGGTFLRLINKHFHRGTKLNKIFNKNSLKVSYSCMPNMSSVIKSHNARVIKGKVDKSPKKMCNCRVKNNCPLNGKCLSKSVVYKATVTSNNMSKEYIGLAGNTFKERFNNHSKSLRQKKYSKETELSKYVWDLERQGDRLCH